MSSAFETGSMKFRYVGQQCIGCNSREVYKDRKTIVEPVFGQIKNLGFDGFSVRSHLKAAGKFALKTQEREPHKADNETFC
ncbi:hypothetical protein [Pseudomonas sp.]|uniref:hypothetical protein n=1 Tax=Pseudomonas sp. TaxID=306 RepID=UPI00299F5283|nr:hypothetical protein [Pseudomonas sp.]MDX1366679.1 hypothetical protein [Pseudomonas sp.]